MEREVLAVRKRVLGANHSDTLSTAGDLAASPAGQGSVDDIQSGCISSRPKSLALALRPSPLQNPLHREQNRASIARRKAAAVGQ
jgi:hypothetical protein